MNTFEDQSSDPMTTTQKLWKPIAELNESHQRTVNQMVQAYAENNSELLARALARKARIEQRLDEAYIKARKHILERMHP